MDEQAIKVLIQAMLEPILEDIKELFKRTNDSGLWQAKYGEKIDKIEKLVEKLTETPAKRWDTIVTSFILGILMLVAGYFFGKLTGK
jgi:thymidylate synthase